MLLLHQIGGENPGIPVIIGDLREIISKTY